jgi:purine nucleosidase
VDDAMALALAFVSPELEVRAVTTVAGNVSLATATANANYLLEVFQPDPMPRFAEGSAKPLERELVTAEHVHGIDGLAGVTDLEGWTRSQVVHPDGCRLGAARAVDVILDEVTNSSEPLTIVAVGPLTNVAAAITRSLVTMQRASSIVVMGGSLEAGGNITPHAEFNFYVDPEAADLVLRSGLPVLVVPLDVTNQLVVDDQAVEGKLLARGTKPATFVGEVLKGAREMEFEGSGSGQFVLHDPGAIAALLWPDLFNLRPIAGGVECGHSDRRGAVTYRTANVDSTIASRSALRATVEVDADEVVHRVIGRILNSDT